MKIPQRYLDRTPALKYHSVQQELFDDTYAIKHRFTVVPAGRRSGKSEIVGKRRLVARAVHGVKGMQNPKYFVAAPTHSQVKKIYWDDLKILCLPWINIAKRPSESNLIIYLNRGQEIHLIGMDKPERIEGPPWVGGVLDEYANMKKHTWLSHVRPALSTPGMPPGWCDFVGVPEGRNHYYRLFKSAKAEQLDKGSKSEWGVFHWKSADILDPKEIESAKKDMDELTFQQEYEGSFINFKGRAYYNFSDDNIAKLSYDPNKPLILCFDFNVDPGVCAVIQDQNYVDKQGVPIIGKTVVGVIGEVYIPKNSNTVTVCNKVIQDWGKHQGRVMIYGDATGGSRGSAKISGTDWDLVRSTLTPTFDSRLHFCVPKINPKERSRINTVNSLCKSVSGEVRFQVDPLKAPHVVLDMEGVSLIEGGSGELDKKVDLSLTHISDAIGYFISKEYPIYEGISGMESFEGF